MTWQEGGENYTRRSFTISPSLRKCQVKPGMMGYERHVARMSDKVIKYRI
jgi:hypothetical protein